MTENNYEGANTPYQPYVLIFHYLWDRKLSNNDISSNFELYKGNQFIEFENAYRLLCESELYVEIDFRRFFDIPITDSYILMEYDASICPTCRSIDCDISEIVKKDTLELLTTITNDAHKENLLTKHYIELEAFKIGVRLVKAHKNATLALTYDRQTGIGTSLFLEHMKEYYSILKELGIVMNKQYIFPNKTIINSSNPL